MLDQTRRQTQRQLEISPPLLWLIRAAVTFLGYGALWWSVRDQHPYAGPSPAAIVIVYTLVGVVLGASVRYSARATAGVGGRSQVLRRAERLTLVVVYIAVYTFMGALQHAGASHAIVYGIYPAVAQLIFIAGVGAAMAAAGPTGRWSPPCWPSSPWARAPRWPGRPAPGWRQAWASRSCSWPTRSGSGCAADDGRAHG